MIIELDFQDVQSLLRRKTELEKLCDALNMYGTQVEEVDKNKIRIEVNPNRPDLVSPEGVARAMNGFLGYDLGLPVWKMDGSSVEVLIEKNSIRPYLAFSSITGIDMNQNIIKSLMQMQEKLHTSFGRNRRKYSIGIYDLDKIRPPITITEMPLDKISFVPLGETREMTGKEIIKKTDKGKKFSGLLKRKAPVFVDSIGTVLSMPPIINSEDTKVDRKTKNFFIDSTGMAEGTDTLVSIVTSALADRGGKIGFISPGPTFFPFHKPFDSDKAQKRLGIKIEPNQLTNLLGKMRVGWNGSDALVPTYRADLNHQIDFTEELAIAYGYDKFKGTLPASNLIGKSLSQNDLAQSLRQIMVGLGFIETRSYVLTSERILSKRGESKLIKAVNAKSEEHSCLRNKLLPGLLDFLEINTDSKYPQRIFEIGEVFSPRQELRIAGAIAHSEASYAEIKGVLDSLSISMGWDLHWALWEDAWFLSGRAALSKKGLFGEIHPELLGEIGLPVTGFEMKLGKD
ncbi:MAG: phenylalanine--tRNA ligase subunit beta [Candidatus Altiarchaeota archaeon]|nr:phenylalanine--tRNA ligase subunit beta [Candidatus Altiarchaeota archaeon]